ncbi:hypothetical protein ABIB40_003060 [Pedobacter sp. UYP30]
MLYLLLGSTFINEKGRVIWKQKPEKTKFNTKFSLINGIKIEL